MLERDYQAGLIKRIKTLLPNCTVVKNDPSYRQGFPDLLVLNGKHWAALEVKVTEDADFQPNQLHYIEKLDEMNFAAVIYPSNEEEVLNALEQALQPCRNPRVSKRK